jgi:hypothetical protein
MEEIYRAVLEGGLPRGVHVYNRGVEPDLRVPGEV